jgi:hypothetical protein
MYPENSQPRYTLSNYSYHLPHHTGLKDPTKYLFYLHSFSPTPVPAQLQLSTVNHAHSHFNENSYVLMSSSLHSEVDAHKYHNLSILRAR